VGEHLSVGAPAMQRPRVLARAPPSEMPCLAEGTPQAWDAKAVDHALEVVCHARAAEVSAHLLQPLQEEIPRRMGVFAGANGVFTARLSRLHHPRGGVESCLQPLEAGLIDPTGHPSPIVVAGARSLQGTSPAGRGRIVAQMAATRRRRNSKGQLRAPRTPVAVLVWGIAAARFAKESTPGVRGRGRCWPSGVNTGRLTGVALMTVRGAPVSHDSQPRDAPRVLGPHRQRAQRLLVGDGLGDLVRDQQRMLAVDDDLPVVAPLHLGALGPRSPVGIGPGALGRTTRRARRHNAAVALRALLEALDRCLPRRFGRLMHTGCFPIGRRQLPPVRCHPRLDGLERLLKRCPGNVVVWAVDGRALPASDRQECCPTALHPPAQEDTLPAKSLPRGGVRVSEVSNGLDVGAPFAQPPEALPMARGFPRQSSAGAKPVEVARAVALAPIPWSISRSPRACGLRPHHSKTLQSETLPLGIKETHRLLCRDLVIEQSRQQKRWGPAVALQVSPPASLLWMGGSVDAGGRWHKELSHSLTLQRTGEQRWLSAWWYSWRLEAVPPPPLCAPRSASSALKIQGAFAVNGSASSAAV
jgi:hypothetical protein